MKLLLQTLFFTCSLLSYAQEVSVNNLNQLLEKEGVKIFVGEGVFEEASNNTSHARYFFTFQNTTDKDLMLKFNKELYYDGICQNCGSDSDEQHYSVMLKANSTASYEENPRDKTYSIFIKDNHGWIKKQLTDFKFINVQISTVK
jgi:hypothetical protein